MAMTTSALPAELGPTLRAWRERLRAPVPELESSARHTPGLRRGELAVRAGISTEYVTQLEQGRAQSPSEQVLLALVRALELTESERDHLFELAGRRPPGPPVQLPTSLLDIIPRMHVPAALCNAAWDLITWNDSWSAIVGDARGLPPDDRNIVLRHFHGLPSRFMRNESQSAFFEVGIVADLRRTLGRNHDDPRTSAVVANLLGSSERFRALWAAPAAAPYDRDRKNLHHPEFGDYELDCVIMDTRHLDYRVILLTAIPGSVGEKVLRHVEMAA